MAVAPVIRGNVLANEMPPPSFPSSNVTHDAELAGAVSEPSGLQDAVPFQASWKATPVSLCQVPPLRKGGYRMAFCPTGSVLALAVNCPNADDSVVFFFSLLTEVGLPVTMYAGKKQKKDRMGRYSHLELSCTPLFQLLTLTTSYVVYQSTIVCYPLATHTVSQLLYLL